MKIKLKDNAKLSDIPRFSGVYKRIHSMLSKEDVALFNEPMPKGWEGYIEEVTTSKTKTKTKGDK